MKRLKQIFLNELLRSKLRSIPLGKFFCEPFWFKNKNFLALLGLLILITPTFISLIRPGFFPMQDDLQAFRIHQMFACFQDFQIPCRWVPDAGYQYGYPQFNYYPPSIYYLGAFFHLFGLPIVDSVKLLFILGFVLSVFAMYFLVRSMMGLWPGFVAAILYSYVPYKAVEVYVRGAMSEFWALVAFPLVLWSLYLMIKNPKLKYIIFVALSTGFLYTTHLLMSMIFLPVMILWALYWLVAEKRFDKLPKFILAGLWGIGLAAFFVLPVSFERPYAHVESLVGGYFDYRQHFASLDQLFISNYWGYGSSFLGPGDDLSLSTGPIHFFVAFVTLFFAAVTFKKKKKISLMVFLLFAIEAVVLIMIHQKSSFIWAKIPPLEFLQFPWRFLSVSIFLLSILGGALVFFVQTINKKLSYVLGLILVIGVIGAHINFFQPKIWYSNIFDQQKFSGKLWEKQLTISIFDYLPIYAKYPPVTKAPALPEVLKGQATFPQYKKGSNYQEFTIIVQENAYIRLPLFFFPGMKVWIDQKPVAIRYDDCQRQEFCLGLISFSVPEGKHTVLAKLTDTPIRIIGNIFSLLSFLLLILVLFPKKLHTKTNVV